MPLMAFVIGVLYPVHLKENTKTELTIPSFSYVKQTHLKSKKVRKQWRKLLKEIQVYKLITYNKELFKIKWMISVVDNLSF